MLRDYQTLTDNLVRDDADKLTSDDRNQALTLAVLRYSHDRPQKIVEDLTADGTNYLALPTKWESDFSTLVSLEYPIGEVPPSMLDQDSYRLYAAPGTESIQTDATLPNTNTVRATFTAAHSLTGDTDTIPARDQHALASWAAAILCDQLAAYFSGESDPTIQADAVDHGGKSRAFAARATRLRQHYFEQLGINPKRSTASGVVVDLDQRASDGGDRIFHKGSLR